MGNTESSITYGGANVPTLPPELFADISKHLAKEGDVDTLARLRRTSSAAYLVPRTAVYPHVEGAVLHDVVSALDLLLDEDTKVNRAIFVRWLRKESQNFALEVPKLFKTLLRRTTRTKRNDPAEYDPQRNTKIDISFVTRHHDTLVFVMQNIIDIIGLVPVFRLLRNELTMAEQWLVVYLFNQIDVKIPEQFLIESGTDDGYYD